jgi:parallel beta-helix repeat protein
VRLALFSGAAAAVALACAASSASAPEAGAKFLYVSPHGRARSACTQRAPCRTITRAVNKARAGDTIQVAKGIYHEDVLITKTVSVVAPFRATVNATGLPNGFNIKGRRATGTVIQGFNVKGATFEGILVQSTSRVVVSDNRVTANDRGAHGPNPTGECTPMGQVPGDCGEGVHLMGVSRSLVADNTVSGNQGGILLTDETGPTAHNTITRNNVLRNLQDCGITIAGHNSRAFSDGRLAPKQAGIYANTITKNVANGNGTKGGGAGILLADGVPGAAVYDNLVSANVADHNGEAGVLLHTHTPNVYLNGNRIVNNALSDDGALGDAEFGESGTVGILIGNATIRPSGLVVRGNTISDVHTGIYTKNTPPIKAKANTFHRVAVRLKQV